MKPRYGKVALFSLAFVLLWAPSPFAAPEKTEMKAGPKVENPPVGRESKEFSPVESYIFVSEKNIFHPDRKEFPVNVPPPAPEVKKPIVHPQVVLHGVTIAGEYEAASVSNPGRVKKPGERELETLRKGASIGDYKLAKILPDRIVLESSEDSFEVLLYDSKVAKKRSDIKTENKPATVTSLGPAPASAPAPAPAPGSATAPVPVRARTPIEAGKVPGPSVARPVVPAPPAPVPAPTPGPSMGVRGRTVPRTLPRAATPGATE